MKERKYSILCIDDDEWLLKIIDDYLQYEGFSVFSASNPMDGFSILRSELIDVILVDIWMPQMDGISFMQEALKEYPDIPFIVISGSRDIEDVIRAHSHGAWEFIAKPIDDMGLLLHSIGRTLEKADLIKKNREYEKFLTEMVNEKTAQLEEMNRNLKNEIEIRKTSEAELRMEKERAEEASKAKSQFLAKMSHEIRTPLNAIVGMTNLTLMTDNEDERLDYLITVRESSDHLITLINDILDFSKIEAGKLKLDPVDIETRRFLDDIIRTMGVKAGEKSLYLTLEVHEDVPEFIFADVSRLRQILINLISNALKFTHRGGVSVSVYPAGDNNDNTMDTDRFTIQLEVKDTGIGISPDRFDAIFESFTQSDDSISRTYGGTGLGLSICRELVLMMQGRIWIESETGRGSTFYVWIPLRKGREVFSHRLRRESALQNTTNHQLSILLAEDNEVNQRLVNAVLKKLNHRVDMAKNGIHVLDMLKEKQYDLILMDIEMPKMDGIETTKHIRRGEAGEEKKNIPIIAITAHVLDEIKDRCISAGMNEYVTKPIKIEELSPIMEWVLQNK